MPTIDKRVDAYIEKSADFAKPILIHLRELIHKAWPDVEENIKWGFPHFDYQGTICSMASFKQHCAFGFWKAKLLTDPKGILSEAKDSAMGHLGRITSLKDLPSNAVITKFVKEAAKLNESGVKLPARKKAPAPKNNTIPKELQAALARNKKAKTHYEAFSPSHQREYIEWVTEAKTDATRDRRIETAIEWIAEGKSRHWKYARK